MNDQLVALYVLKMNKGRTNDGTRVKIQNVMDNSICPITNYLLFPHSLWVYVNRRLHIFRRSSQVEAVEYSSIRDAILQNTYIEKLLSSSNITSAYDDGESVDKLFGNDETAALAKEMSKMVVRVKPRPKTPP
jgi:hypothetical protein